MTSQSLLPYQLSGKGTAVASDFRLPWNTTRSMADVWAEEFAARQRRRAETRKERFARDRVIRFSLRREADLAASLEMVATNG